MGGEVKILKLLNSELTVRNKQEKIKTVDVLVETKNKMKINLELNTSNDLATRVRNMHYLTSFYSQQSKRGERYDVETSFVQINLNYNALEDEDIVERYTFKNEVGKPRKVNLSIIDVNMDKLMQVCYDKPEKLKKYKYLHMLDVKDINELEKISKGDKVMEKYKDKIEEINSDPEFVFDYEDDRIRLENTKIYLKEKEVKQETAKKMLNENLDIDVIQKCTELSIEDIKDIQKEMQN